ncbi:MAG: cupin domain-containing protein [Ornithinimicrobium sp.]|jgi:quercetin dioxygenase-like cupin family protein|uniref:cupin domain-containing protein n=1 Tax=Ornithinimicrobium sp. TaxID=1977084 RepID=UPI003D9BD406
MAEILDATPFPVPGGKTIDELVGRVSSGHTNVSVAHMTAEAGWSEPGQVPEFEEITYVIAGSLEVHHDESKLTVPAGQAVLARCREWVRYEAGDEGAEYLAICVPAFDAHAAHREE